MKYTKPEISEIKFCKEDVIMTSFVNLLKSASFAQPAKGQSFDEKWSELYNW